MDTDAELRTAREALTRARAAIATDLGNYPTPISGCDVQYTHLLGQRDAVTAALRALDAPRFYATPRIQSPGARVESR